MSRCNVSEAVLRKNFIEEWQSMLGAVKKHQLTIRAVVLQPWQVVDTQMKIIHQFYEASSQ